MDKTKKEFSYSRFDKFINCPFSYFLNYEQGHYINFPTIATNFGTLVHKILENEAGYIKEGKEIPYKELIREFTDTDFLAKHIYDDEDGMLAIDEISEMFPEEWIDTNSKSGKSYKQKAMDFIEKGIYRLPKYMEEHPNYEIVGCEIPFKFEYNGIPFKGYIDRLLREKGTNHYIIHDIKTKDSLFTDTATCLQFVIYSLALQDKYGEDITFECVYDLPMLDTYQQVCTPGYIERGKKKIDKVFSRIKDKDWTPRPSPLCYWCPYRLDGAIDNNYCIQLCSYYSLWEPNNKTFKTKLPWKGIENDYKQLQKLEQLKEIEATDIDQVEI